MKTKTQIKQEDFLGIRLETTWTHIDRAVRKLLKDTGKPKQSKRDK